MRGIIQIGKLLTDFQSEPPLSFIMLKGERIVVVDSQIPKFAFFGYVIQQRYVGNKQSQKQKYQHIKPVSPACSPKESIGKKQQKLQRYLFFSKIQISNLIPQLYIKKMSTIKIWSMTTIVVLLALTFSASAYFDKSKVQGGQNFIELGNWRIGNFDDNHFAFTHKSGKTAMLLTNYGTVYRGPRTDFNLWLKPKLRSATGIVYGDRYIQFGGVFRLAQIDVQHLSLSHIVGNTAAIWKADGWTAAGPRTDYNGFKIPNSNKTNQIKYGKNILQIGLFRMGEIEDTNLSIGQAMVNQIYYDNGGAYNGPHGPQYSLAGVDL